MKYIKSCGFVVYKQIGIENYYLVIKSLNGDIGFPKGHKEDGENELQTAVRELKEETNVEVNVIEGFKYQIEYKMPEIIDTIKQVIYFLGICVKDDIICQEKEVEEARFIRFEEALEVLTFQETKNILNSAQEFIKSIK